MKPGTSIAVSRKVYNFCFAWEPKYYLMFSKNYIKTCPHLYEVKQNSQMNPFYEKFWEEQAKLNRSNNKRNCYHPDLIKYISSFVITSMYMFLALCIDVYIIYSGTVCCYMLKAERHMKCYNNPMFLFCLRPALFHVIG